MEPIIILTGRKDHEVVAFADYERDMAESTDRALAAMEVLRHELAQARELIWCMAKAAGGEIRVSWFDRVSYDKHTAVTEIADDPESMGIRVRALVPSPPTQRKDR